eukprot:148374-Chlamydomonas_euryale.AAC.1
MQPSPVRHDPHPGMHLRAWSGRLLHAAQPCAPCATSSHASACMAWPSAACSPAMRAMHAHAPCLCACLRMRHAHNAHTSPSHARMSACVAFTPCRHACGLA